MIRLGTHSYISGELHTLGQLEIIVGNYTSIAEQCKAYGGQANHPWVMNRCAVSNYPFADLLGLKYTRCGGKTTITIGSDVWIGANTTLLAGITIGHGAIIGAGSVVTKDVPPYAVVVGNPGTIKKYRFTEYQITRLLKIAWWDMSEEDVREIVPLMEDVTMFLDEYRTVLDNKL